MPHQLGYFFPKGLYENNMYSHLLHLLSHETANYSLVGLATRVGVQFRFASKVQRIVVVNGSANAVVVNEMEEAFYFIVSNADVQTTYDRLMPKQKRPSLTLDRPKSSSVIVFYWGMKGEFSQLGIHNLFLSANPKEEYHHLFKKETVYSDSSVYLYISAKQNPSDAPYGCENWFSMVSVPHDTGQHWDALINQVRGDIISKLSRQLKADVAPFIVCESVMDSRYIAEKISSAMGSVFGNSSNGIFSAFLRHPNFTNKIKNLYFTGGSVHPGSSIPLCLLSAKITAEMIEKRSLLL